MGALRRLNGLSEDEARQTIAQVKASGENVRWNRGARDTSGKARPSPIRVESTLKDEANQIVRGDYTLPDGRSSRNVPAIYGPTDYIDRETGELVRNDAITKPRGQIIVSERLRPSTNDPAVIQRLVEALRHESVHRWFSPKTAKGKILQRLMPERLLDARARMGQNAYIDNPYIKFLEEAIAQGYAKRSLIEGVKFPFEYGYTTPGKAGLAAAKYHGLLTGGIIGGYQLGRLGAESWYGDREGQMDLGVGPPPTATSATKGHAGGGYRAGARVVGRTAP